MAKRVYYPIGSISSGTLRDEDLLSAFAGELDSLASRKDTAVSAKIRRAHRALAAEAESFDPETADFDAGELIADLMAALQEYAAPYFYFGTLEGDGAEFGFYVSPDIFEQHGCFDGLRVADTAEVPRNYRGEVLHVTDHGNATLYVANGRGHLREVWAIV